jgi:xylulose-5-phosphate/fructose-6-phosphate phosphoketolase
MRAIGEYLKDVIKRNPHDFRIFSPDELASNKLDNVFDVTHRNFQPDPQTAHAGGRVSEMLSEHSLQGWMQVRFCLLSSSFFPPFRSPSFPSLPSSPC